MILTFKSQIVPSSIQENILWDLSEKCRLLYNLGLLERYTVWELNKKLNNKENIFISYIDQQNALPKLKSIYPEYKWVYSKVLQMVLRTLDRDFNSFATLCRKKDSNAHPPKFKGKKYFTTLKYNQHGFRIKKNFLTISHKHPLKHPLTFKISFLPVEKIKQTEIYFDIKQKKWYACFNCEVKTPSYQDNGLYQAFDVGIENIVSGLNSQGKFLQIVNKRPEKYWRKKISEIQSKRDNCKRYSNKWTRYNTRLFQMNRKLANQIRDFQHKISKKIISNTKSNTLIFGKPSIKSMIKNKNFKKTNIKTKSLHFSIQNTGILSRFIELVTYKAEKVGKKVLPIDESYTTKIWLNSIF
jgi:putative transposase